MSDTTTYPYDDDYMIFDDTRKHYVLTEEALLAEGVDIRNRISNNAVVSPESIIDSMLGRVSDMIYNYIHQFNADNPLQDRLIATVPSLRNIIQRAMTIQAIYIAEVGDLSLSEKKEEREQAVDSVAKNILAVIVPELHTSILYAGRW